MHYSRFNLGPACKANYSQVLFPKNMDLGSITTVNSHAHTHARAHAQAGHFYLPSVPLHSAPCVLRNMGGYADELLFDLAVVLLVAFLSARERHEYTHMSFDSD